MLAGEPMLFGPAPDNIPGDHEYSAAITIGATATAATWFGYGVDVTRPTATTMKITFGKAYAKLMYFGQGRFPVAATSQVSAIITTDNLTVDGSLTLTFVAAGTATAPASGDQFYFRFIVTADALNAAFQGVVA